MAKNQKSPLSIGKGVEQFLSSTPPTTFKSV